MIPFRGTKAFILIWFSQFVSTFGAGITAFALGVWVYQRTGSSTQLALMYVVGILPRIVMLALSGGLADRWNRRDTMLLGNAGAALSTMIIVLLLFAGRYELWAIYLALAGVSMSMALHWPAYLASITQLVPERHLGRANGLVQLGESVFWSISPLLGGWLIAYFQIQYIILIEFCAIVFAIIILLICYIPRHQVFGAGDGAKEASPLQRATFGWRYIVSHPHLFSLMLFHGSILLMMGIGHLVLTPMVLSFASPVVLGTILGIGGFGMLLGGIVMTVWGGPKRHISGVFGFFLISGIGAIIVGLRPSTIVVAIGLTIVLFCLPIAQGCILTIWQRRVPSHLQGRVFSIRYMTIQFFVLFAYLVAGPLGDHVFEPLLRVGGPLASSIGQIFGAGSGRGMGFLMSLTGIVMVMTVVAGYFYPRLRLIELTNISESTKEKSE